MRRLLAFVLLLSFVPMSRAHASATAPLDTRADLAAALDQEHRILDHFHYGQVHEQLYRTSEKVPGDILTIEGENDSALYTGNYLAAESFRYALAKIKLAKSPGSTFWKRQRDDALWRVKRMAGKFNLLINISRDWNEEFDPHLNSDRPPTDDGFIDFGGGIFPGEAGHLMRACNPVDAPAPINVGRDPKRDRLVGPLRWGNGKSYYCLDATSRDAYAGTTFGLVTALDLVGPDEPDMRQMIANDLMDMTDYALKYYWNQPRPHGEVVIPEVFGGNDLDNFYSPLFIYTPMARLNMMQVARHAADVIGATDKQSLYELHWIAELATQLPQLAQSMELDNGQPHDSYYKFHLNHMTAFNLVRLERNPTIRDMFREAYAALDSTTGDDINALFEAMTFAMTGEPKRREMAAVHHRQWLDYRSNGDAVGNTVRNSSRCGKQVTCVPQDRLEISVSGQTVTIPGGSPDIRSAEPLPVRWRRPADFMWQKDPTILDGGQAPTWASAGADFLLPYWMLRYYTEGRPPKLEPFPAWHFPTFR